MKKVFIIHGFNSSPNSSWFTWLMAELKKLDIYGVSLPMPKHTEPNKEEWVEEINRQIKMSEPDDQIYLVGHCLGGATILNFLQKYGPNQVKGVVLVSTRYKKGENPKTNSFYENFNFEKIKERCDSFIVIHGDNDTLVPVEDAYILGKNLEVEPIIIENGGHLNGRAGYRELPECLEALNSIMK